MEDKTSAVCANDRCYRHWSFSSLSVCHVTTTVNTELAEREVSSSVAVASTAGTQLCVLGD